MIKKFLSMVAIAGMVFTTSCSSDEFEPAQNGGEAVVSFTTELPSSLQSRAFGDGTTATNLSYFVYDENWNYLTALSAENGEKMNGLTATVNLQLVNGETYNVVFWADAVDAPYTFDADSAKVAMNYANAAANAENRDAFYKVEKFTVNGNMTRKVELTRPFAQINIGTTDWADVVKNTNVSIENTGITVKTYPTLNFKNGKAEGDETTVTFAPTAMPEGEKFPVGADDEYKYLSMNYILATTEKQVVDVTISYDDAVQDRTFTSVPVQRNYRTNIYGKLITSDEQFNVEINPIFDGEWPNGTLEELKLAAKVGGTFVLSEDIVLDGRLIVNTDLTIDLNGKTISMNQPDANNYNIMFYVGNGGNLTFKGEGNVRAEGGNSVDMAVYVYGGTVNIEGGYFYGQGKENEGCDLIYAYGENSTVNISGGKFEMASLNPKDFAAPQYTALNISKNGKITVTGGTFVKFDPANNVSDGPNTNYCAEGYQSVKNDDGTYTVLNESEIMQTWVDPIVIADGGDITFENLVADKFVEICHKSGNMTLKNITFENGLCIYTNEIDNNGTVTLEDCDIYLSDGVKANDGQNQCNADYGLNLNLVNGSNITFKFKNCTFTAKDGHSYRTDESKGYNVYIGGGYSAKSITFTGCVFEKSGKHGIGCSSAGDSQYYELTVTGCNFKDWSNSPICTNGAAIRGNLPSASFDAKINISGNTFGNNNGSTQKAVAIDSWTGTWN